jgi:hypothetical protein
MFRRARRRLTDENVWQYFQFRAHIVAVSLRRASGDQFNARNQRQGFGGFPSDASSFTSSAAKPGTSATNPR